MAPRVFAVLLTTALIASACDVSQQKPETGRSVNAPPPTVESGNATSGERSIRLFGPGISRHRQIRA